jgi:hypothetical protein
MDMLRRGNLSVIGMCLYQSLNFANKSRFVLVLLLFVHCLVDGSAPRMLLQHNEIVRKQQRLPQDLVGIIHLTLWEK